MSHILPGKGHTVKSILLIDDDLEFAQVAQHIIEHLGHIVSLAESVDDAKQWLTTNEYDHVFIDFMLPDGSGLHVYEHLKNISRRVPKVTFITGNPKIKTAISHIVGPNVGYLMKPLEREDIESVLAHKNKKHSHAEQVYTSNASDKLIRKSSVSAHFDCLIGESDAMQNLFTMIERVARSRANVMIMGESGVGKELVAQAIHNAAEPKGDFIATNCGGLSKELIGSELFGHEKGAFTGAISQKIGVFERANSGTLFLDEITEMPLEMQSHLLRVLETQSLNRVGGTKSIPVDCRVISATNRSVESIATDKVLREDIYFRLAVFPIEVPPLRNRKSDIPCLVHYFLSQLNQEHGEAFEISDAQLEMLSANDWPGNVRELKHCLHRAFIMSEPGSKSLDMPSVFNSPFSNRKPDTLSAGKTIEEVEKELIYATLQEVDNNKTLAAEMLGISTKTLYNRLHAYGDEL